MKLISSTLICLIGLVLLAPHLAFALDIPVRPQPGVELLQEVWQMVRACEQLIAVWERDGKILRSLTLAVGILGILTGMLQKYENRWCRVATVIAGALVSAITVVDNTVFSGDHRTISNKVLVAHQKLDLIRIQIRSFNPDDPNKENQLEWYHNVIDKLWEIRKLDMDVPGVSSFVDIGVTVHAASGPFPSPFQFPAERTLLQFEGRADSTALKEAREKSFQEAISTAVKRLDELHNPGRPGSPTYPISALRAYVTQIAHVEADSYHYNPKSRLYTYSTRIAIEKRFAESKLVGTFVNKASVGGQLMVASDLGGGNPLHRVRITAPSRRDGDFWFTFRFVRQSIGKVRISLEDIHVFEDGSSFATTWAFDVLVNRQLAFTVPRRSYDKGHKPGAYRMMNVDQIVAIGHKQPLEIVVVGYRPEHDPR